MNYGIGRTIKKLLTTHTRGTCYRESCQRRANWYRVSGSLRFGASFRKKIHFLSRGKMATKIRCKTNGMAEEHGLCRAVATRKIGRARRISAGTEEKIYSREREASLENERNAWAGVEWRKKSARRKRERVGGERKAARKIANRTNLALKSFYFSWDDDAPLEQTPGAPYR